MQARVHKKCLQNQYGIKLIENQFGEYYLLALSLEELL